MAYKSGHIYIVDHEPTDEEVAGFAKPVEFYVGSNGKYYSILFDKNGNKYVQDASKVVTGFIKIGEISQIGRIITIGVHPSGFNHWRINGVDVTTENPSILEIEPVADGKFRVDYIVGNSGGGLFILPGVEGKYPIEINPLDYSSFAFFQRVLVTPDGLGVGAGGSSQNTTYQTIQSGSSTNFSIDYDGVMTRFRIVTNIDVPKTLLSINFDEETDKALEFQIFNDTNLNINVPASASLGLRKGFSLNTPFAILPKSYALLKYNPDADLLEFWKVNSSGFALPITGNTGDVLEKDPTAVSGAKWTGTLRANLDAEIVNRAIGDANLQTQVNTNNTAIADLNVHSIAITTSSSITTDTTDANGKSQNGREVAIKNGVNAINITCELTSSANFLASYTKEGSAAITVVAGAGATLYQTDGANVINGIKGSTFCIKRSGNEFQLQVSNR